jgi:hypothetical protein
MNALNDFKLFVAAVEAKERALAYRHSSIGISVDADQYALDYQAADCIARTTKHDIEVALGKKPTVVICPHCGYEGICECKWLLERGVDTHHIKIEDGIVYYKE